MPPIDWTAGLLQIATLFSAVFLLGMVGYLLDAYFCRLAR